MELQHWQAQFENWLKNHHQHQDAAHDLCHFRRVWATAQKLAADDDVDMLVILTACYFHDIVSLAKNHPQRQRSSILAAEETRRLLREGCGSAGSPGGDWPGARICRFRGIGLGAV